jgi:hypothetical protein
MARYENYRLIYGAGLLVFLFSFLAEWAGSVYMLMFFLSSINLIIAREPVPEEPTHSTVDHYQRESRWNWLNYGVAGYLVASSLLYWFSPVSKPLTVLILWTILLAAYARGMHWAQRKLMADLIVSYVNEQLPQISHRDITKAVQLVMHNKRRTDADLEKYIHLPKETLAQVRRYISTYVEQNKLAI